MRLLNSLLFATRPFLDRFVCRVFVPSSAHALQEVDCSSVRFDVGRHMQENTFPRIYLRYLSLNRPVSTKISTRKSNNMKHSQKKKQKKKGNTC